MFGAVPKTGLQKALDGTATERIDVLLGRRGDGSKAAVLRGEIEKMVNAIVDEREKRASRPRENPDGETENGRFSRLPNGTQLCWHRIAGLTAVDTAYDGGFRSPIFTWDFPSPFIDPEKIAIGITPASSRLLGVSLEKVGTDSCRWFVTSPVTRASAMASAHFLAAGLWK